jgi:hypothetical protein
MLHSAFLDFLETIYSKLAFLIRDSYSAFYSAHFILRYYTFIFNLHFALPGAPTREISAFKLRHQAYIRYRLQQPGFSSDPKSFLINSHSICSSYTHILFLEHHRPIRAHNSQILFFLPYLAIPTSTTINFYLLFIFLLILH